MLEPSKTSPMGPAPTATLLVTLPSLTRIFDTVPELLATQTWDPSKAIEYGVASTATVAKVGTVRRS